MKYVIPNPLPFSPSLSLGDEKNIFFLILNLMKIWVSVSMLSLQLSLWDKIELRKLIRPSDIFILYLDTNLSGMDFFHFEFEIVVS